MNNTVNMDSYPLLETFYVFLFSALSYALYTPMGMQPMRHKTQTKKMTL